MDFTIEMEEQDKAASAKKLQKSYFDVLGICCSSEIPLVENILKQLDGVKDVSVIVASRTVIVVHDSLLVPPAQIVSALNQARLEANVKMRGDGNHEMKWPSPYAVASGVLLLLSLLKYTYRPFEWIALGAVAVGIFPIIFRAMMALRNMRLDINVLAVIAVAGTISMRDYLEAATIVFLFSIAEWLQSMASHKARAAMSSLMSIAPQKATIVETGEEVDVNDVKLNTILAVKAGEVIPIDGIVVDGKSEVDEKTLTGESFPVPKEKDSSVWAGTINLNGYLSVKTTAMAEDCVVAKMAKLVEEAQNKKSKTQKIVDRFAQYYTPAIVIVFLCVLVIPVALRVRNRDYWIKLALVILVSGCPCALVLSTPVATFCALTKAAKSGLLIKGGDYLETLAKVKTVAFDKTGTVTKGEFVVAEFKVLSSEVSQETLLYWVSSIESKSSHPLAASIVHYGMSSGIAPKPEYVEEFQNFPGEGIYGRIDGRDLFIGNKKIASRAGSQTVPDFDGENEMGGKTVGYIYLGSDLVGSFSLSDECRTGVIEAIRELKSKNIRTVMLTGDCLAAAMNAQSQLGGTLDQVYAELLPEDKSRIIQQLKENGRTAMVGDGINDAPALASSDIGISMGISGSALATETGHVILMSNDIRKIPKAINLAARARRKIIENVLLSFSTRLAILGLAIAKHPLVWAAVLADTGTCILVIMNSMLLLGGRHKHQHLEKCSRKACGDEKEQKCSSRKISSGQNRHQCCSKKSRGSADSPHVHTDHHSEPKNMARKSCCEPKNKAQQSCCEPKTKAQQKCCESNKIKAQQSCCEPKTKAQQKCCESNKIKAQQSCCQPKNGARKNCCEPTKPGCAAEEVSCEPRICSSKCSHPSQPTVSSGEITEIPNPDRKHGCCSGNNTVKCEPGAASHDSGNRCSKFSNNHDHVANASKVNVHRCSPTGQNTKKDNCCANDLEKNIHGSNSKFTCDQTGCCNEKKNECRSQACGNPGVHHCDQDHKSWREPGPDDTNMARMAQSDCCSLEKREIGRCCQSYMKECCKSHHGHLHHGFGGSLTEIIIE